MSDKLLITGGGGAPTEHVDEVVKACDSLLAVLCDAAHGWRIAAEAIADETLAARMLELANEKEEFAGQLSEIILSRSGEIPHDHTGRGKLLNWWLELRASMSHGNPATILGICHTGSKALVHEYDRALKTVAEPLVHDVLVYQARRVEAAEEWLASVA